MIPLYGCQAGGGKIYSLDDPSVVKDGASVAGSGGSVYQPYFVTTKLGNQFDMGYNKLRRFQQHLEHAGSCTLVLTAVRDGAETGVPITRTLPAGAMGLVTAPMNATGSSFQIKLVLSAFSAEVTLGTADAFVIPKREWR